MMVALTVSITRLIVGRGDRVLCSHCHFRNHTIDKCYKLHGYTPGHPKFKSQISQGGAQAHQASSVTETNPCTQGDSLTQNQCKQLIEFLSSKIQTGQNLPMEHQPETKVSCFTGIRSATSHISTISQMDWVMDTGATHHIFCSISMFNSSRAIQSKVTLPNAFTVPVMLIGSVAVTSDLTLKNVLYVPDFQFNLLSISSLTNNRKCSVFSCLISAKSRTPARAGRLGWVKGLETCMCCHNRIGLLLLMFVAPPPL
ncbi:hypothetical protein F511_17237 [Dorcoceras hygrometricum]|uniref:Retrovirus-related Pol polyprotein from transposon TNT 1-94-like beta-barrel domain-containing protein n=1 Tax=Dorcoceras hygrometricum TaxID=472368 RepID=A0A2Z7CSU4_9LAMI|nr:hypothetical protein F511_17237 [Dorcoceras hygrometricum]